MSDHNHLSHKVEASAVLTVIGIFILFFSAVAVILIAPRFVDPTWTSPTSPYQVQMYEISDPNLYISGARGRGLKLEFVNHLKDGFTLLGFKEDDTVRIIAPKELEKYITRSQDPVLKLTSRLLMLRRPEGASIVVAENTRKQLQADWEKAHPHWKEEGLTKTDYTVYELYVPEGKEAFAVADSEDELSNWVDQNFKILDETAAHPYHQDAGVIYVKNPKEYRVAHAKFGPEEEWHYDPAGEKVSDLKRLKGPELGFMSRKELIELGEHIFTIEGCWYCHTDQTRTLIQDVVLNGSDSFPAPPSSSNEYIYQKVTFMGTKRNGPDISRVGIKRPSRDWHKGHFWSPKTVSRGSIMPAFRHFFDNDPRGTAGNPYGVPNYRFEAVFQYLMTKGTRITAPTQAWWQGKDPIDTKAIIEGRKTLVN